MAIDLANLIRDAVPLLIECRALSWSYDEEADVLYVSIKDAAATDSDLTDDNLILRYEDDDLIGVTVLDASKRAAPA